jgi:hypothetical protein
MSHLLQVAIGEFYMSRYIHFIQILGMFKTVLIVSMVELIFYLLKNFVFNNKIPGAKMLVLSAFLTAVDSVLV